MNKEQATDWVRLVRPHHWAKNILVAVPLVTAHAFDSLSIALTLAAMLVLSLAASAIYIVNDAVDREADRRHPSKCRRPLAAGRLPVRPALGLALGLAVVALAAAFLIRVPFGLLVVGYLLLTTAYSLALKRRLMVDVVVLSILYTLRVAGGALAIGVPLSEWLLAFSLFVFSALALVKRQTELARLTAEGLDDPLSRAYRKQDLPAITALAAALGFNSVTVLALYISSPAVAGLYQNPLGLWMLCPIITYWLGRLLLLGHRGDLHDDPIVFALKDPTSLLVLGLTGLVLAAAL